jgi:alkylation response protein AidB-like acyl-CoA dehydrogenase
MRVIESAEETRFRSEVRDWLHDNVPRERRPLEGPEQHAFDCAWQRKQFDGGWAGISWPTEYGGRGLSLVEQLIWFEEYALADAPPSGAMFIGLSHGGPTLIVKGNAAQKAAHLPPILRGDHIWCQGFSEPGAGSDLASLKTSAEIDGDHLIVNGSKIWTTYAMFADYQELLVRTNKDKPRHKGISWVICDMRSPGIEIRPIKAMSGLTHFCQVFYDNVRIPLANIVGEVDEGWSVAMATLGFERGTASIAHQIELSRTMDRLIELAGQIPGPEGEARAIDNQALAADLARLKAEVSALQAMSVMSISRGMRETVPGAEGNLVALHFGELVRKVYGFAFDLLGPRALEAKTAFGEWPLQYLEAFKWGIGGGTLEIRRNTIAERFLGLPRN